MQWNKGIPRFFLSMLGAAVVVAILWTLGFGVWSAFTRWGGGMGTAAIVSVIIFVIATFAFMEE